MEPLQSCRYGLSCFSLFLVQLKNVLCIQQVLEVRRANCVFLAYGAQRRSPADGTFRPSNFAHRTSERSCIPCMGKDVTMGRSFRTQMAMVLAHCTAFRLSSATRRNNPRRRPDLTVSCLVWSSDVPYHCRLHGTDLLYQIQVPFRTDRCWRHLLRCSQGCFQDLLQSEAQRAVSEAGNPGCTRNQRC